MTVSNLFEHIRNIPNQVNTEFLLAQSRTSIFPTPEQLCPRNACQFLDSKYYQNGLYGLTELAVDIATLMAFVIGALAIVMFMWAALLFLVGGEKGADRAKKVIVNSIIAVLIAAFSFSVVSALLGILNGNLVGP